MGKPVPSDRFVVFTNKSCELSKASPGIIWLISVEGKPKQYAISWRFESDGFTFSPNPDFKYAVLGKTGQNFDPPLPLPATALALLAEATGQFRHGFSELDPGAIEALEAVVAAKA